MTSRRALTLVPSRLINVNSCLKTSRLSCHWSRWQNEWWYENKWSLWLTVAVYNTCTVALAEEVGESNAYTQVVTDWCSLSGNVQAECEPRCYSDWSFAGGVCKQTHREQTLLISQIAMVRAHKATINFFPTACLQWSSQSCLYIAENLSCPFAHLAIYFTAFIRLSMCVLTWDISNLSCRKAPPFIQNIFTVSFFKSRSLSSIIIGLLAMKRF